MKCIAFCFINATLHCIFLDSRLYNVELYFFSSAVNDKNLFNSLNTAEIESLGDGQGI